MGGSRLKDAQPNRSVLTIRFASARLVIPAKAGIPFFGVAPEGGFRLSPE